MNISNSKFWTFLIVAIFAATVVSCDDDDDNDDNKGREGINKVILQEIAYANNAEIDFGQMAISKGDSVVVKNFGQLMVTDHQKALYDLDTVADNRNISLPTGLKQDMQNLRTRLSGLSGYSFDTAYINSQMKMHTNTKNMFQSVLDTSDDQSLRNYVNRYLPTVTLHLQKADSIQEAL